MPTPEQRARHQIDQSLSAAGWAVQDASAVNLSAARGIAVREFPLKGGFGQVDYLLYVDRRVVGAVEAKPESDTLTGVKPQTGRYSDGLPDTVPARLRPLPFLYISTGAETRFTDQPGGHPLSYLRLVARLEQRPERPSSVQ